MGQTTAIQWTHHTFNAVRGCTKVHTGCTNCYAEVNVGVKFHGIKWGPNGTRAIPAASGWHEPVKWNRAAQKAGERRRVFCASLGDVFEDWQGSLVNAAGATLFTINGNEFFTEGEYPECRPATMDDMRRKLFRLIDATPWLSWLLLTKRPENIRRMWPKWRHEYEDKSAGPWHESFRPNVWLGTSSSDQATADVWIPRLLECRDLAPVLFLSAEPLIGPIDLLKWLVPGKANWECQQCGGFYASRGDCPHCHAGEIFATGSHAANRRDPSNKFTGWTNRQPIDWVIAGGEGHGERPCNVEWIRSIVGQCQAAGVPVFVKQLGSRPYWMPKDGPAGNWAEHVRFDYERNGEESKHRIILREPKGGDLDEWPADLSVREFPLIGATK